MLSIIKHLSIGLSFYFCRRIFIKCIKKYYPSIKDGDITAFLSQPNKYRKNIKTVFLTITGLTIILCFALYLFGKFGTSINDYLRVIAVIILFTGSMSRFPFTDMTWGFASLPEKIDKSLYFTSQLFGTMFLIFALWF